MHTLLRLEKLVYFTYNGTRYFYVFNAQNDITHLVDDTGTVVASYIYDAWGNHQVLDASGIENTSADFIGNINPYRYRGYLYDTDSGLYYCNARYYSPDLCRWISPDSIEYLDSNTIGGLNLYCYCMNNPINYVDPSGHFPFFILTAIIGAVIGVGIIAAVDYIPDKEFNLHWGWYVGAGVLGAAIGAGIGMVVSYYATGSITSSTGQVFSGLFGKTTLYRSVGPDELADIQKTGKFNLGKGMESKQFGLSLDDTRMFGNHPLINQPNIVGAKIPNRVLHRLDFTPVDVGIFKSGIVTVQSSMLNTFNNSLISIMFL